MSAGDLIVVVMFLILLGLIGLVVYLALQNYNLRRQMAPLNKANQKMKQYVLERDGEIKTLREYIRAREAELIDTSGEIPDQLLETPYEIATPSGSTEADTGLMRRIRDEEPYEVAPKHAVVPPTRVRPRPNNSSAVYRGIAERATSE